MLNQTVRAKIKLFTRALQVHSSSVDCARELFKSCIDFV